MVDRISGIRTVGTAFRACMYIRYIRQGRLLYTEPASYAGKRCASQKAEKWVARYVPDQESACPKRNQPSQIRPSQCGWPILACDLDVAVAIGITWPGNPIFLSFCLSAQTVACWTRPCQPPYAMLVLRILCRMCGFGCIVHALLLVN